MTEGTSSAALAGGGAPAPAPAPAADGGGAPAPAPAPAPEGVSWLGENADPELVGYVQNKGWKQPADVLEGYRNLEKMRGVPAERLLTLPANDADEATRAQFYEKLGRPKEPAGYEFDLGENNPFDGPLREAFHKHGVSKEQAEGVLKDYLAAEQAHMTRQQEEHALNVQTEHKALLKEWGQAAEQNLDTVRQAQKALGWDNDTLDKVAGALGHRKTMEMLHSIGMRKGEADFVVGNGGGGNQMLTPGQARAKIAELRNDKGWADRYLKGDSKARAELQALTKFLD